MKTCGIFAMLVSLAILAVASADAAMQDVASNYSTWSDGDNQGSGFGAWDMWSDGSNSGFYLGDSSSGLNGNSDLNTGGQSFAMYGHGGEYANAARFFSSALGAGDVFSIQLGANYRNGAKGLNILDFNGYATLFTFSVASDQYLYQNNGGGGSSTDLGWIYKADSILTLSFTKQSLANTYGVIISRNDGEFFTSTMNFGTEADGFKLFVGATDNGDPENALYANNLQIIPEPASLLLITIGIPALSIWRRRIQSIS